MMTSEELMSSYRESLSEEAFGEVVRRYIDLVYSTALRKVNGDVHLAEDVTQTVFTDLALKARTAAPIRALGGWLHRHTCFVSANVVRSEIRRRNHEKEAMNTTGNEPSWNEIAPHLDDALELLSPDERQAIMLRFFERRDYKAVGRELGLSDDAAQKRVSRAVDKLRDLLARRGVTVSVAVLITVLGGEALQAAPSGLAAQVTVTAVKASAATGGLMLLLLKIMASTKIKLAIGSAVVLALVLTPAIVQTTSSGKKSETRVVNAPTATEGALAQDTTSTGESAPKVNVAPTNATEKSQLHLTILDAVDGKPVRSVQILGWSEGGPIRRIDNTITVTDRDGQADVPYRPKGPQLELFLRKELYADTRLIWEMKNGDLVPDSYTVKLSRAVRISGQVVGPDGEPVAGAQVGFNHEDAPDSRTRPASHEFGWVETLTDTQGHWEITRISRDMIDRIYGSASHPDYVGSPMVSAASHPEVAKQLLEGSHVFTLGQAVSVRGIVVDAANQPIADATVSAGHVGESGRRETKTGADGAFVIKGCPIGKNLLSAEAAGYAGTTISADFSTNAEPYALVLQAGRMFRLKVVDKSGKPISGANVWLNTFERGPFSAASSPPLTQVEFGEKTDSEGRVSWDSAPDKDLQFDIAASGFMRKNLVPIHPDGKEHVVTLDGALVISGTVRSSAGQPIPRFKMVLGWPSGGSSGNPVEAHYSSIDRFTVSFQNGAFSHTLEEEVCGGYSNCVFKIEAAGYGRYTSRVIEFAEGQAQFDIQLGAAASKNVKVLLPDGSPAVGAAVAVVTPDSKFNLTPGGFDRSQSSGTFLTAGEKGTVRFDDDGTVSRLIIASLDGYTEVSARQINDQSTVVLQPWGSIEGVYNPTVPDRSPFELFLQFPDGGQELALDFHAFKVAVDAAGKFSWPKVPSGKIELVKLIIFEPPAESGLRKTWSHSPLGVFAEVLPGKTTSVTLPGGYAISARLVAPDGFDKPDFANVMTPRPEPPAEIALDRAALMKWHQRPENWAATMKTRSYPMHFRDGVWVVEGVPAGGLYVLSSAIMDPSDQDHMRRLYEIKMPVNVPSEPAGGVLDLGEIELAPVAVQ